MSKMKLIAIFVLRIANNELGVVSDTDLKDEDKRLMTDEPHSTTVHVHSDRMKQQIDLIIGNSHAIQLKYY